MTTVESDSYETVGNIIKRKTLAIIQKMSYWSLISIIRFWQASSKWVAISGINGKPINYRWNPAPSRRFPVCMRTLLRCFITSATMTLTEPDSLSRSNHGRRSIAFCADLSCAWYPLCYRAWTEKKNGINFSVSPLCCWMKAMRLFMKDGLNALIFMATVLCCHPAG